MPFNKDLLTYHSILNEKVKQFAIPTKRPSIRAMSKDNLPLGLLNKHLLALDLGPYVVFESENDLFVGRDGAVTNAVVG